MLKEVSSRITYAQEKIIKLIKERKLRQWCITNGLDHASIYRIGTGERPANYKIISAMVHLIAPIEWLFYTDEKLPYEPQILPVWNPEKKCKFIKEHKHEYKDVAKKYNISAASAYKLFADDAYRIKPSIAFMRECCKDTNPVDFFIDGEEAECSAEKSFFYPERGDIINLQENIYLVISKKETIKQQNCLTCCPVTSIEGTIELKETKTKGFINPVNLQTFFLTSKCQASFIETVPEKITMKVLEQSRKIFE
jgi:hypothetical protein